MVNYDTYNIVFQEVPNEISLAFTIKGCTNNCIDCHSPHLREKIGSVLDIELIIKLINIYKNQITCVLFLGGDGYHNEIINFCKFIKDNNLKTAFYSGNDVLNSDLVKVLDYYKIGSYKKEFGALNSKTTNQKLYNINEGKLIDITNLFWK